MLSSHVLSIYKPDLATRKISIQSKNITMKQCLNYIILFLTFLHIRCAQDVRHEFHNHTAHVIDDHKLVAISGAGDVANMNEILDHILVPRVVGTAGHKSVQKYLKDVMTDLRWTIDTDRFDDKTPNMGVLTFENIIATLNPNAERFLVLACHYDSKYFANSEFLGATDSAVPCAMLINLATVLAKYLDQNRTNNELSIKLLFFDGEEAFKDWTDTDSIYGSRHLAARWEKEGFLPKIDMMVLLDLLGLPDPNFYNFFKNTEKWYMHFVDIENRLFEVGQMEQYSYSSVATKTKPGSYFVESSLNSHVEDDHIPFLRRGVPIIHLIPIPFPEIWHKPSDNRSAIDMHTVENLNRLLRIFVVEYLHLSV